MTGFSRVARIGAILMFVAVLYCGVVYGQQINATILGRITDSSGAVVPGASIQIQNPATGFSRTETADSDGRYLSSNLPLGNYTVTVTKDGFQTLVRSGIELTVGADITINAELVVGNVQQRVEVTGEAPQIETSNATISGLVSQDQLRDLPLNGRNVDQLALLTPGVFVQHAFGANTTVGLGLHITIDGIRPEFNLYLLDGSYTNNTEAGRSSAAGQQLGVEGILEYRILTHGASSEYGRTGGAVINAVTRSGTNEFHGSGYEFVRNTVFNSTNYFSTSVPPYHRNQFGGALGGPILKNKVFFFVNYEGLRARLGTPVTVSVPDQASLNTVTNPTMAQDLTLYPSPSLCSPGTDKNGACNVVQNYSQPVTEDYSMMRLDWKISDKDSFFGRFVYDPSITALNQAVPIFVTAIGGNDHFLQLNETHIFSPSTLNEFRFALNLTDPSTNSYNLVPIPASYVTNSGFVPGGEFGSFTFAVGVNNSGSAAIATLGPATSTVQNFVQNVIQESDTVTMIRGAHTIKYGVDVERIQLNIISAGTSTGSYTFPNLAAVLSATPSNYVLQPSNSASNPNRGWRRTLFGSFIQDDIRLRPNLTVNLGLRWEFITNPNEINGKESANPFPALAQKNVQGTPFLAPKANFAPRIGLAWDPTGSGKTSVRAGVGIYDNQLDGRAWFNNASTNADFLQKINVSNPGFGPGALTLALNTSLSNPLNGTIGDQQVQYFSKEPTIYQWNLDIQRQLASSLSLRVGYVGSRGIHLPGTDELNTRIPIGSGSTVAFSPTASGAASQVNPFYGDMQSVQTGFASSYNALQAVLQKTLSAGLNFQVSYTYSKAESDADQVTSGPSSSIPGSVMNPYDFLQDWSRSAYDQTHTLVANGAYQMPWDKWVNGAIAKRVLGGWAINGIYSFGSGLPFTVLDGYNDSNDNDTTFVPDRPNLLAGFSNNPTSGVSAGCGSIKAGTPLHTPTLWFDPCAFAPTLSTTATPTVLSGTFGNLGRNTVIGSHLSTLDFTLVKTTQITEKTKLEFRAEVFNLFNHPNLGLPNNTISSKPTTAGTFTYAGNAGQITTTSVDNREIQLGMKFLF